jgi:thymidylate synthase
LNPNKTNLFEMTMDDITLNNYQSHSAIKANMAV